MQVRKNRLITLISCIKNKKISGLLSILMAASSALAQPMPTLIPPSPDIVGKAYVLMDANSGTILAEKDADKAVEPASLTKMMTMYVVSSFLHDHQLALRDEVRISKNAWETEGSKLFVKHGEKVPVLTLIKGIIVVSGNDASIALAEHIAGSEKAFVSLMNSTAAQLGMNHTHFYNVTGLPHDGHTASVKDLAILAKALVHDYPDEYQWYKEKWLSYNGIKQPNRNRLLWRDTHVDGIKTGHTESAGYCLVSSAQQGNMRLIAVVVGEPSDNARTDDSQSLITWGFRFFETRELYQANQPLVKARAWMGKSSHVPLGVQQRTSVTLAKGLWKQVKPSFDLTKTIKAPIKAGTSLGTVVLKNHDGEVVAKVPLVALSDVEQGGFFARLFDRIALLFHGWFG